MSEPRAGDDAIGEVRTDADYSTYRPLAWVIALLIAVWLSFIVMLAITVALIRWMI